MSSGPSGFRAGFLVVLSALLAVTGVVFLVRLPATAAGPDLPGRRIRAHVAFLADDLLEGREAGTRGYDIAAHYAASQLALAGLAPAADDGSYFQQVPLQRSTIATSSLAVGPAAAPSPLTIPAEALVVPNSRRPHVAVTAPVVYAGYGVTAPDLHHDDYAGLDARDKFVLVLYNAPASFPSEIRAVYGSAQQKLRIAADHGAAGVLIAFAPDDQKRLPWSRLQALVSQPAITTVGPDGVPVMSEPRIPAMAYVSEVGLRRLLAGGSLSPEAAYEAAAQGRIASTPLVTTAALSVDTTYEAAVSDNVTGVLAGSDPALNGTSVVLTAHLDHLGVRPEQPGDHVYNGAYDNATGSAILLEVARAFGSAAGRPRRSVLVVLLTAEEKGLLGSDYFARFPVRRAGRIVANVNLDMPVFEAPSKDIVAFGSENSTLEDIVSRAVAAEGYALSPDPMPEENVFARSDQYSFVKRGIPAVYLEPGFTASAPGVSGRDVFEKFLGTNYHQPSDDLSLPFDEAAAGRFAELNYRVARAIADDPVAPAWKAGNFFGRIFGRQGR